jgi:acyl carrier protein
MNIDFNQFLVLLKEQYLDDVGEIKKENKLRELSGWDSMTGMTILLMIEENYKLKIDNDQFKKLITVEDLYSYLNDQS